MAASSTLQHLPPTQLLVLMRLVVLQQQQHRTLVLALVLLMVQGTTLHLPQLLELTQHSRQMAKQQHMMLERNQVGHSCGFCSVYVRFKASTAMLWLVSADNLACCAAVPGV